MTVYELMAKLGAAGIKLWVEAGQLKFKAPKGALTPALKEELVAHKEAVIAFLSEARVAADVGSGTIPKADRNQAIPLSHAQQRLWFVEQLNPGSSTFHIPAALFLTGLLDQAALQRAFLNLIQRHEALRTVFIQEGEEPIQVVQQWEEFPIPCEDLTQLPDAERLQAVTRLAEREVRASFDLSVGPLIRARLYKLDDNRHGLIVTMHHIVTDGWSMGVLVREIAALYAAERMGTRATLPELEIQYPDYAAWQRQWLQGEELERQLSYWRRVLDRAPAQLALPFDRPRPALQTLNGATEAVVISAELASRLRQVARQFDTTLYVVVMAAYKVVLAKWAQQKDLCVGMPVAGRNHAEVEGLIGFFVNTLVIRTRLHGNPSLRELVEQVKQQILGAQGHQDVPFEAIVEELNTPRNLSFSPLYQVALSLTGGEGTARKLTLGGLEIEPMPIELVAARLDLTMMLVDHGDAVDGMLEYNTDLFDGATIRRFLQHFQRVLQSLSNDLEQHFDALALYEEAELSEHLARDRAVDAVLPLTSMQRDFCLDSLRDPTTLRNSIGFVMPLNRVDPQRLQQAIQQVANNNAMLRSRMVGCDLPGADSLYQLILNTADIELEQQRLQVADLTPEQLQERLYDLALVPWEVEDKPLIRYFLVHADTNAQYLVIAAHHSVYDGVSKPIHLRKLALAYAGVDDAATRDADDLHRIRQWIQHNNQCMDQPTTLEYWSRELEHYQAPAARRQNPGSLQAVTWNLEQPAVAELQKWCSHQGVSLANYFRTLYLLALQRCFHQADEFALVDAISGRDEVSEGLIGCVFQFTPHVQHSSALECTEFTEVLQHNRQWKKTVGNARHISMLARQAFLARDALEFQFNYRLESVTETLNFAGEDVSLTPVQPDNSGIVKLLATRTGHGLRLRFSYYDGEFAGFDLLDRMRRVHGHVIAGNTRLAELPWLFDAERQWLLECGRGPQKSIGPGIVQRFADQVRRTPQAPAVICGEHSLSFAELDQISNQWAGLLRTQGAQPGSRAALALGRSLHTLPLYLAVIKTGAAYIPLDTNYPAQRIQYILSDADADLLVTEDCVQQRWQASGSEVVAKRLLLLEQGLARLTEFSGAATACPDDPEAVLYYVYTSGSTGQPKGAGVFHRGESNLQDWYLSLLALQPGDRVLLVSALGFDLTQKNLFAGLCSGAALVIPEQDEYDPEYLQALIARHQVTVINCAPSAFYPLLEQAPALSGVRHVVLGGEPIRTAAVADWLNAGAGQRALTNSYGPTECTDVVAAFTVHQLDREQTAMPIGSALPNTQLFVVNSRGQLMPRGAAGELRIAGAGVGAGYWQRPALNEELFHDCPHADGRWYRSGDICRFQSDGQLEYQGRADFQVKLRGLRIELGEVDSLLKACAGVRDALSLVRDDRLYSYLLADKAVDTAAVMDALRQQLPDYMVPAALITVPAWPLTPNGKVDRNALPTPAAAGEEHFVAPSNDSEQQLADIWCQVLKLPRVSVTANFFEAGGHSLLATQVVSRMRKAFGIELSVRALFEAPTIAQLVQLISTAGSDRFQQQAPPLEPLNPPNRDTLSFAQYRLWFVDQLNQGSSEYNLPMALKIQGPLDVAVLDRVFGEVVSRHEVLRTNFAEEDGVPRLLVHEPRPWQSELVDLSQLSEDQQQAEIQRRVDADAARVFSLLEDSLLSTRILRLGPESHVLLLNMHHIVSDGWSMGVLLQEIQALYPAFAAGQSSPLPPLPIQYADFAVWQRNWLQGEVLDQLRDYWQQALHGAPDVLRLPTDKPRPKHQTFNGAHLPVTLDAALSQQINRFCEQNDMTPFMVLMAAYQILLSRYAGQKDICVGIPIAGRNRAELEGLIGFFINGLVIRTRMEDNPSVLEYLDQVKEVALGAYAHQDMPADLLLDALKLERSADTSPGAQVGFALQNVARETIQAQMAGLSIEPLAREHKTAKYELSLILQEGDTGFSGVFEYNTDLFLESTIADMARHYRNTLGAMLEHPEQMVEQISMLERGECYRLLQVDPARYELRELSPMQRDMYLDAQLQPDTLKNSLGYHFIVAGEFDAQAWISANQALAREQPLLRARLLPSDIPYTDVAYLLVDREASIEVHFEDWSQRQISDRQAAAHAQQLIWQPYDIHGAMSQYFLFRLDADRHLAVFRMNHILLDGAAMAVQLQQACALADQAPRTPAPDIFAEYVADSRRRTDSSPVLKYWRQQSQTLEALDFPLPAAEPPAAQRIERSLRLDHAHWQRIGAFCAEHRITPALYFKALYGLLIQAYCRSEADFYLSEVIGGRTGPHRRSLGNYFQVLPVVFPQRLFSPQTRLTELLQHLRSYRKSVRANSQISLLAQRRLLPQGRLNFMFNYYNFIPSMNLFGKPMQLKAYPQVQDGPVQFVVHEQDGWVELNLMYLSDRFADLSFLQRMEQISEAVLEGAERIADLELRLPAEQTGFGELLGADTALPWPTVLHGFQHQVVANPAAVAVRQGSRQLSYGELDQQSSALAGWLQSQGVSADERVALCLARSPDMLVAVLAVIKTGAAYVPLDSNYPVERLALIMADSGARVLLTHGCVQQRLQEAEMALPGTQLLLDQDHQWRDWQPVTLSEPHADTPLYVIYTSGSTGSPKGAEVTHGGEVNLQQWYLQAVQASAKDRFLLLGAFGFDLTQKNLFAPLLAGGSLVIPEMTDYDLEQVATTIDQQQVTVVNCAPSAFYPLVEGSELPGYPFPGLRYLILGGEPIRTAVLRPWLQQVSCRLINSYGPTECTDVVAWHTYDPAADGEQVPIGRPLANTQLYVVDGAGQRLPPGIVGELCIAGAGVGPGYVNRPELTSRAFAPNPYSPGQWYRTGDLVRQRSDGALEYLGRRDFQVKLRGLRIELGEIEAALREHPAIADSLVLVRDEQLMAYVVAADDIPVEAIRASLRQRLPDYMVPAVIVPLPRWPLTPNGKVDRKALPNPEHSGRPPYVAPRNTTEEKLVAIWSQVLGVERIGVHDSFFDLGGHSLLAARAVARFRQEFDVDIQLRALFELHTIEDIARYLDTLTWAAEAAEQAGSDANGGAGREEGML